MTGPAVAIAALFAPVLVVAAPLAMRLGDALDAGRLTRPTRLAWLAAPVAALAFVLPVGLAAGLLTIPWLAMTAARAVLAVAAWLGDAERLRLNAALVARIATGFLAFGAGNLTAERFGIPVLTFAPIIVLLTAVHFHVAGAILPTVGAHLWRRDPSTPIAVAIAAVIVGAPVTAAGFLGIPGAALGGAILVAGGGFAIGVGTVRAASSAGRPAAILMRVAGASLLVSMPLAIGWAIGDAVGAGWMTLPFMAATHGTLNALGFALPISVAWSLILADPGR